jgi:hypothetical protein
MPRELEPVLRALAALLGLTAIFLGAPLARVPPDKDAGIYLLAAGAGFLALAISGSARRG